MTLKELVLKGINHREKVHLPAYGVDVEVRPLSDLELAACRRDSKILSAISKSGVTTVDSLIDADPVTIINKFSKIENGPEELLDSVFKLYREIVKRGVTNPELREIVDNPNKDIPGEPEKVMVIELLTGGSIPLIAEKILEITTGSDVKGFSKPTTEKSS